MYRPNRIGPWPVYQSLSPPILMTSASRFASANFVGISLRPAPVNAAVGDHSDATFAYRNLTLTNLSANMVCPSILLRSDYDDIPLDGMMVSLSGSQTIYYSNGPCVIIDMVFGVLGTSIIPTNRSAVTNGSASYRRLPMVSTIFEHPDQNCFITQSSWNGSIIVPGGHTNPFFFGFLYRNVGSVNVSAINVEGTLSASVYRGDLDVFDPVR